MQEVKAVSNSDRADCSFDTVTHEVDPIDQINDHADLSNELEQSSTFCEITNMSAFLFIERFVDEIHVSEKPAFLRNLSPSHTPNSDSYFYAMPLAKYFEDVSRCYESIKPLSNYYVYSEKTKVFLSTYERNSLHMLRWSQPDAFSDELGCCQWIAFNALVEDIRSECRSEWYWNSVVHRRRENNRCFKNYIEYVQRLFDNHSRLLVVRLDLSYRKDASCSTHLVDLQQVKSDLPRFLRSKRRHPLFEHMVGYIWKLEYGDLKGYHYHLLLFFNGNEVRSDYYKAKTLGEYWCNKITNGRGLYFNCNKKVNEYMYPGIGMIHAIRPEDQELRSNLINRVLKYLIKTEQYLKVKLKEGDRTISRGGMPEKKGLAGRPRNDIEV